jgi:hypothetical protein
VTAQQQGQQGHGWQWPQQPLKPTTARWLNRRRRVRTARGEWTDKWSKVLAHRGPYSQFRYGTDTPSDWRGYLQVAIICSPWSGVIGMDVDCEQDYLATRTGQLIVRDQAISIRGDRFHALTDARAVPPELWPKQGPIAGADIKSNGFIPLPGCVHYSGDIYEPVPGAPIVTATPELIGAILADREDHDRARQGAGNGQSGGGNGGTGGGHDGEIAATVLSNILRGLSKEECYAEWCEIAIPHDPDDPFIRRDFERHYGDETQGAVRKAAGIRQREEQAHEVLRQWIAQVTR